MLTIAVCDDNTIHLQTAERSVKDLLYERDESFEIKAFITPEELLREIENSSCIPQIAVLDIEMGDLDGISLAKKINGLLPDCRIIFLTGYLQYAQSAYEAEHIWFVVKKDAGQYLKPALDKAIDSLKNTASFPPGILLRENRSSRFLPLSDILYISKVGRKAQVVCLDGEYYDSRSPVKLITPGIERYFIRCHQGYWINIQKIRELDHNSFVLVNGIRLPVSRSYKEKARERFFEALSRQI